MNRRYDAIVVGARLAGAATGMLLAREGLDVLVVDRARHGSDTLSTHALMRGGVLQLHRWGLLDEVVAAGTPPIRRAVMRYGREEEVVPVKPRPGYDALYAPRRTVIDRILADAALRAGAEMRFGTTVTGLTRSADGVVTGVMMVDPTGAPFEARAAIVIGAEGHRSLVAGAVEAPVTCSTSNASAFCVGWYSGVEADGYQWLYGHAPDGRGRTGGIIPTNDGQVCAWAGLPASSFAGRRPEQHVDEVLGWIAPDWAARLRSGRRHGPVRGFPGLPGVVRRAWGPGWALVGDAGYFRDPVTAHGMTDALRDAELLARAVLTGTRDPILAPSALAAYERTRDELSLPLLAITDRIAAYRWSLEELRALLLDLATAMKPEVDHLTGLTPLTDLVPTAS
jgi:flavin-dependent dehydrogenase